MDEAGVEHTHVLARPDWNAAAAAVVVCDMWNATHCVSAQKRQLVAFGKRAVLCRDLTDSFHRDVRGHAWGNEAIVAHIERRWCPTVTSDDLLAQRTSVEQPPVPDGIRHTKR